MKTGWEDGVGMEEKRVVGVVGRREKEDKMEFKKRAQQQSRAKKTVWEEKELMAETGVIKGVRECVFGVCACIIAGLCADNVL